MNYDIIILYYGVSYEIEITNEAVLMSIFDGIIFRVVRFKARGFFVLRMLSRERVKEKYIFTCVWLLIFN